MARPLVILGFAVSGALAACKPITPPNSAGMMNRVWSTSPGLAWNHSYMAGNGRLGAAVQGIPQVEPIHLNRGFVLG
jgi:hypothetical protein